MDVTPDQEMIEEGVLRDLVNRVQRLRKEFKIVPTDDIVVYYQVSNQESKLNALIKKSVEYLESNIKKPVQVYDNSLKLNVKGKIFEVISITKVTFFLIKFNFNYLLVFGFKSGTLG
jgi:hypothetical protein